MNEETVAKKMKEKGYHYIVILDKAEPLYTKTLETAIATMNTYGLHPNRIMLIDKYLEKMDEYDCFIGKESNV